MNDQNHCTKLQTAQTLTPVISSAMCIAVLVCSVSGPVLTLDRPLASAMNTINYNETYSITLTCS